MVLTLKEKVKTIFSLLSEPKVFSALVSLRAWGYLVDMGWFNSFKNKNPLDKYGNPIPWFTFPAVEFLIERLNKEMIVFEFGSGNSTLFFADRVREIYSVEHDTGWFEKVLKSLPSNSHLHLVESKTSQSYLEPIRSENKKYDIIIVDGIFRNECMVESLKHLSENGIIILDDSERKEYLEGVSQVEEKGFKRLNFWGISPGYLYRKATTIFYKPKNCLNI